MLGDVLVDAGGDELLHAQLDLALLWIDIEDLRLHYIAHAEHVLRMVDALVGADLADVNQAFDAVGQLNKRAKVHELGDRTFNLRSYGKLLRRIEPRIGLSVLEAERDAALLGLDGEDDGVNTVALLENVAGVAHFFAVGHF